MPRTLGARKEQILKISTELFSQDGYDSVTVKKIGEACNITEPAVYRHYESKEAIYVAVLESLENRLEHEKIFAELSSENDIEQLLLGIARHIISFFTDNADLYRLLLFSALRGHQKASQVYAMIRGTYQEFLKNQLDRLYNDDHIIEKNNEITARCFVGMVFDCALGRTLWKGMQGSIFPPETIIQNNVPIYAKGLSKH